MDSKYKAVLVVTAFMLVLSAASRADSSYALGLAAFKAGQYQQAIDNFEAALSDAVNPSKIHYNLATSYYKLKQYSQAHHHFKLVTEDPALAGLAYYNLGLTSVRADNLTQAKDYFQHAYETAEDAQIKALAAKQLEKFRSAPATDKRKSENKGAFSSYISLSHNYDDNISNENEDLLTTKLSSDKYTDLFGYVNYRLKQDNTVSNSFKLGGYVSRYATFSENDQQQINLAISQRRVIGAWQGLFSLQVHRDKVGARDFQQRYTYLMRGDLAYSDSQRLRLQYDYARFDSLDKIYEPLDGSRHRFRLENLSELSDDNAFAIGYRYENNIRNDALTPSAFTSYSPYRHSIYMRYNHQFNTKWDAQFDTEYRTTNYKFANVTTTENFGVREDRRGRTSIQLTRVINKYIEVAATYRYTSNDSNYIDRIYKSNYLGMSLDISYF